MISSKGIVITFSTFIIGLLICLAVVFAESDPNIPIDTSMKQADPNAIKLPEGVKMPVQLKCPVHGIIGKAFIVIKTDNGTKIYCSRCAKTFVSEVFDMNLPELEIVK